MFFPINIDNDLARQGTLWDGLLESKFAWGDGVRGASSLAQWDYVRYGVVPEPSSLSCCILAAVVLRRVRSR